PGREGASRRGRDSGDLGGLDATWSKSSGRAVRPDAASSVGPIAIHYWASLRPCLGTAIAPRRRARFRQTLLGQDLAERDDLPAVDGPRPWFRGKVEARAGAGGVVRDELQARVRADEARHLRHVAGIVEAPH